MKKNIFVEELMRRGKEDNNAYSMIGTELKRARTSQSQTLSAVAGDLCSVSYLCKVEKAQLKPNRYMLNEICKKLNVDSPKLDLLFKLRDLLSKVVNFYYTGQYHEIEKMYESCKEFDNYRTKLIFLIYYISQYNLEEANEISIELFRITSVMHDDELSIFMVFYSILKYYEENYSETLDNLKTLSNLTGLDEILGKIASMVCLECYVKINSPMTILQCQKLLDIFLKSSEFDKAEYVRYLQTLYMIQNELYEYAEREMKYIKSPEYKNTLELIYDYKRKKVKRQKSYKPLRPFGKLLYTYLYDSKNYLTVFCSMDKTLGYACDFSNNIANYFSLSDDVERYSELVDIIIPNIKQTKHAAERSFFLKEFCRISSNFGRYKNFCKAYEALEGDWIE
ncbi:hypothetical protein HDR67_01155 [bacterium]|nr:hypothetical protein [bacterium]